MNSILTNSAALSALQALTNVQNDMNITQNQVSTGLAVQTAADNAAYWSIGQQLTSAEGIETAANTALQQSQAIMDTATSAIQSVITTIDQIQSAVTEASNPGASLTNINSTLASLSSQLGQTISGASFNGVNLLNGTQSTLAIVAGYNASASGGTVSTISFTANALIGGVTAAGAVAQTSATSVVSSASLIAALDAGTVGTAGTGASYTLTTTDATTGLSTTSTYTGYTSYDETNPSNSVLATTTGAFSSATNATGSTVWTVQTVESGGTNASASGLLIQSGQTSTQGTYNLTALGSGTGNTAVTAANATDMLSAINQALAAVTTYAATIGTTQDAMTAASTFNSAVSTDYTNGVSALVDADMNTASTRLQALQTQEQLGIQSLSIANQNSQLILKLFNG
jgi:flagellin